MPVEREGQNDGATSARGDAQTISIATMLKEGLVVGMRSMPGKSPRRPHFGRNLIDEGYRGVVIEGVRILRSGQQRGITRP